MNIQTTLCYLGVIFGVFDSIFARTSEELRITLPNGSRLLGRGLRSRNGRIIKAFMGIPYAKPPIGELRFKAPEKISPWDGEYQATYQRAMCTQIDPYMRKDGVEGSEDCLHLNVYTPYSNDKKTDLPVMVWIHGGGFLCGSSDNTLYGPQNLLDHDIVYVSVNYRLGPLGFLSSGQKDCTGNFGLKDQVLALQWVQENIKIFGGDPKSVTIFGESAGGASVTYLMMSPLTKGLISRAIAQSGTSLTAWGQPPHKGVAPKHAAKLAKVFDCETPNDWQKTIDCLRNVPAENITSATYNFFKWDRDPVVPFPPVVEPDLPGAFITKHPLKFDKQSSKIPLMTGITHDEGIIKSSLLTHFPELLDDFNKKLESVLPISLYYDHHDKSIQDYLTAKIVDFYFKKEVPSAKKLTNLTNLFTDAWFLAGMDSYLQSRLSQQNAAPTYVYLFTHKGPASFSEAFNQDVQNFYGISHGDELQFLFPLENEVFINALPTESDDEIRKAMTELWVNFAKTGNPTPDSTDLPQWIATKEYPLKYYRIGNYHFEGEPRLGMELDGVFEDRAELWKEIGAHLPARMHNKKVEL